MPDSKELVIFTQTYDLLTWLLPHCERLPKNQRFVVTQRLQAAALDFQEAIFEANARSDGQRLQHLQAADAQLNKLRLYLRAWHGSGIGSAVVSTSTRAASSPRLAACSAAGFARPRPVAAAAELHAAIARAMSSVRMPQRAWSR